MEQASLFSCIREGKRVEGGIVQEKSLSIPPFFFIFPFLEKRIKEEFSAHSRETRGRVFLYRVFLY